MLGVNSSCHNGFYCTSEAAQQNLSVKASQFFDFFFFLRQWDTENVCVKLSLYVIIILQVFNKLNSGNQINK